MTVIIAALTTGMWLAGMFWLVMVFIPFAVFSALIALWLPSTRYELGPDKLVLRCGPIRYDIAVKDIQSVTRRNLVFNPISSVRGPGFALFRVPYLDQGVVTMCATRSLKGIVLIVTSRRKYGITPHEEDEFLSELTRLRRNG